MGSRPRITARSAAGAALFVLAVLAVAPGAVAQQYGESQGTLAVNQLLEVSGDGFSPGSTVKVELRNGDTGEVIDLGFLTGDDAGRLRGAIALPEGLAGGGYTLTATGVTPDGATRVLSAELQLPGLKTGETPPEPSDGMPVWLVVLLAALGPVLAGGAWWWGFVTGRRRGPATRPAAEAEPSGDGEGGGRGSA